MREVLMMRFSEIHLKGLNRPYFMRMLVERVKEAVKAVRGRVWLSDSRVYVSDAADMEEALRRVRKVFGVHSVCRAVEMDKSDFPAILAQSVEMMRGVQGSFKVEARRSDKRYPLDSMQINREIGHYVLERLPQLTVDVIKPQSRLYIEIRDHAYLYSEPLPAVGGMPVGTNGRATVLLSGGIDSPVAAWMIAKRGVAMSAVHFQSPPYTSERARDKVLALGPHSGRKPVRAYRAFGAVYRPADANSRALPPGLHHHHHAPLHDAHRLPHRPAGARAGAGHGGEHRPGGKPDHARPADDRQRIGASGVPPADRV